MPARQALLLKKSRRYWKYEHSLIINEVARGRKVCFRGFGDYKPKEYKAKAVRNIKQGTTFTMPAKKKPVFKASPYFCKEVAGE